MGARAEERPLGDADGLALRKNLLLILQILAACLLIAALADPSLASFRRDVRRHGGGGRLERQHEGEGQKGTRFEPARKEFLSLVDELSSGQKNDAHRRRRRSRVSSFLSPRTSARLRDAGAKYGRDGRARADQGSNSLRPCVSQTGKPGSCRGDQRRRFHRGRGVRPGQAAHLRFIRVGGGRDNVGIVGFEVRRHAERRARYEVMVHVRNFTD